ncbi:adenylyltransferase/cytidyltransferase family protein [Pelagibacteraceae bacterium]|nr:adenylyltransferase/cytidyltransferase family protein [Pelagibacteraceae bacterium]
MIIGYTSGVYDLFHVGHLNILRKAKSMCDKLIVGVTTDELAREKVRRTIIPFNERIEIIQSIVYVDAAVPQDSYDKISAWQKYNFDLMFVGDDWQNSERFNEIENKLNQQNVKIIYFPYTKNTSSTLINKTLVSLRK